jgi:membrane peptidoglycan carboxypeptidase
VSRYFGTNADGLIYQDAATLAATMPESGSPPAGTPIQ